APLFVFVYLAANHFPWDERYRPELTPGWQDLGNSPEVDEYVRRQTMSAHDYKDFVARLTREFPGEPFLLVRFGDHQPDFAKRIIEPELDEDSIARRVQAHDPRDFTTYYAIDAITFDRVDLSSALDTLEAPYLPLVIQEAAGLPLDPSFLEQKKILQRCDGAFYLCGGGAEARRFNRLLIDAGLIKNLSASAHVDHVTRRRASHQPPVAGVAASSYCRRPRSARRRVPDPLRERAGAVPRRALPARLGLVQFLLARPVSPPRRGGGAVAAARL